MAGSAHHLAPSAEEIAPPAGRLLPLVAGAVGLVALVAAALTGGAGEGGATGLLASYLVAFVFWLTLALGGLFFVLVQHLTRSGWSVVVRRLAEHLMATLPLFAVLFLPIAFGLGELYPWVHAPGDHLVEHKAPYLNPTRFFAFAAVYFAVWIGLSAFYWRQSTRQDTEGGTRITRRLQTFSAPAMILFALTVNFAAFDWLMTLEPHWFSTVFGVYFFAGCVVAVFAALPVLLVCLRRAGRLVTAVSPEHLHDVGKMLFGFTVFWAYIAFSQFMLIWYGNIPEETAWYDHRWQGGWRTVSIVLAAGHFALPFLLLLSRGVKRRLGVLAAVAGWLLAMHWLDLFWLVKPSVAGHGAAFGLADVLCLVGIGGLFVATLALLLGRHKLLPAGDPRLAESLAFENP